MGKMFTISIEWLRWRDILMRVFQGVGTRLWCGSILTWKECRARLQVTARAPRPMDLLEEIRIPVRIWVRRDSDCVSSVPVIR